MIIIALQVWLPLNGNLENNGVGNPTISCNATVDNTGKIGKCYVCAFGNHISFTNPITTSTTDFAISCWVYVTEYTNEYSCVCSSRTATSGKGLALWIRSGSIRFDDGENWNVSNTFTLNTWTHICVTYSKTNGKSIYVNGNLIGSKSTVGTLANLRSELFIGYDHYGYYLGGKINDLRVWEGSTPSPKEIEVLSRGLVLHYPMTGGIGGQDNLIPNSSGYDGTTGWGNSGLSSVTIEDCPYGKCIKITSPSTASTRNNISQYITSTIGTNNYGTYTLSFYYKAETTNVQSGVGAFVRFANTSSPYNNRFDSTSSLTLDGQWHFCSITKDISNLNDTGVTSAIIFLFAYQGTVWYSKLKLELGTKSTPYVPYSGDNIYTSVGYNDNIEYDVSGYNHHGTKVGTLTYDSDTPRYSACTTFDGTSVINCGNDYNVQGAKNMSISLWAYLPDWTISTKQVFISSQQSGGFYIQRGSGTSISFRCNYYNAEDLSSHTYSTITHACTLTGWHMLTATYDTSAIRLYVDGVQVTSASLSGSYGVYFNPATSVNTYIGAEATGSSYESPVTSGCKISDVRIYYTTLTDDQVERLYNTPVSLSNNGTLLTQGEFVET